MKMVNSLQQAILFITFCCVTSQSNFSPFQIKVVRRQPAKILSNPVQTLPSVPAASSDQCSQHPGSTCMFVLLCLMGGGVAAGPCSGGLLSTCCVPRNKQPPNKAPVTFRHPNQHPNQHPNHIPIMPSLEKHTDDRVDTTVAPLKNKNYTLCGIAQTKPQSRIIGGNDAMYGEFPWQVHIKLNRQQCGGVLLNNYYVLTAAHCIYEVNLSDIVIQLGVYDTQDQSRQEHAAQTFSVVEKKIHPKFQFQAAHPDRYDVALLKLSHPVQYHDTVSPICLPRKDWKFQGWKGIITGWGKTDSGLSNRFGTRLLQKVDVPIISNEQCEKWHHEKGIDITISQEMLCAGYEEGKKDACVGDSGGPLMVMVHGRWVVIGLVSAGYGCAQSRQPGIYHRVPSTVDWLRDNIVS